MRLVFLTLAALVAFASNSILARAAMGPGAMDAAAFTAVRIAAGAAMLGLLLGLRDGRLRPAGSWPGAMALLAYAAAFSFAYLSLDAGLGALILFGAVQLTMFAGGLLGGERPHWQRWMGMAMGLGGLAILFLPGASAPPLVGAALMLVSGVAWGVYSLQGRSAADALGATAGNFLRAAPLALLLWLAAGGQGAGLPNIALAAASGALASGLGYAIWYAALPKLEASLAAIAQLTVPLIALGAGMLWLGEAAEWRFLVAAALILGGVALAVLRRPAR